MMHFVSVPEQWDRRGLPAWAYHSQAQYQLECEELFLRHWQIVGHVNDIPKIGDWLSFDLINERAVIMRGKDNTVRAFHNICRHRGGRVVAGKKGNCKAAIVCPFHGWVYNLDGTLRGPARPETFGEMNRDDFGLKPLEMDVFHGFIFLRFNPGPQPCVSEWLSAFDADFSAYGVANWMPAALQSWSTTLPVNWKSVRDVDNEGYHVPLAHPGLQDLYGRSYYDKSLEEALSFSEATFGDQPGRLWSVRHYIKLSSGPKPLPDRLKNKWNYYGMFPNAVIATTPEAIQFYHEFPLSPSLTKLTGRVYRSPDETREMRAARYLAARIDRETGQEDQQLSIWSDESMRSKSFESFYLSDLEYGLRCHHDQLRKIMPFLNLEDAPDGETYAELNKKMLAEV
jgi:phenylpropionate dioxygenase-like ring-hydroxylating dioxygenase large terminal subunit